MSKNNNFPFGLSIIITVAIIFFVYHFNIQPARANHADLKTQTIMQTNYSAGIEAMKKSLLINPYHLVDMRNDFGRVIISYAQSSEALKAEIYQQSVDFIMEELKKNIQEHPLELQSYILLGQFYSVKNDLARAEDIFSRARELSPKRQQLAYYLVRIKSIKRDYAGAIEILNQLIKDNDKIADNYWYLALVQSDAGDLVVSHANLKLALERGKSFINSQELLFAAQLVVKSNDWETARDLYEQALAKDLKNPAILLTLSEIYARLNDASRAREMAARAALYDVDALKKAKKWLK